MHHFRTLLCIAIDSYNEDIGHEHQGSILHYSTSVSKKKKNTPTAFKIRQIVFIVQIQANFIHGTSSSFPGGEVSCIGHCIYTTLVL